MKTFFYCFEDSIKSILPISLFSIVGYFFSKYIYNGATEYDIYILYILSAFIALCLIYLILTFIHDCVYFKCSYEIYKEKQLKIKNLNIERKIFVSDIQNSLEMLFKYTKPSYLYSNKFIEDNLSLVLSIGALSVYADSDENLQHEINKFINYIKKFHNKNINEMDIKTIKSINLKFHSIVKSIKE